MVSRLFYDLFLFLKIHAPSPRVWVGVETMVYMCLNTHAEAREGHPVTCSFTFGLPPLRQGILLSLHLGHSDHPLSAPLGLQSYMCPGESELRHVLMLGQQGLSPTGRSIWFLSCFGGTASHSLAKASLGLTI